MKEQETFTVYKAVRLVMGDFVSSIAGHPHFPETQDWELRYVLGYETVAHEGSMGILCFTSAKACRDYIEQLPSLYNSGRGFAVLECTTPHVPHQPLSILRNHTKPFLRLVAQYAIWSQRRSGWDTMTPPAGTVTVPSLTPRCIYKEDTR